MLSTLSLKMQITRNSAILFITFLSSQSSIIGSKTYFSYQTLKLRHNLYNFHHKQIIAIDKSFFQIYSQFEDLINGLSMHVLLETQKSFRKICEDFPYEELNNNEHRQLINICDLLLSVVDDAVDGVYLFFGKFHSGILKNSTTEVMFQRQFKNLSEPYEEEKVKEYLKLAQNLIETNSLFVFDLKEKLEIFEKGLIKLSTDLNSIAINIEKCTTTDVIVVNECISPQLKYHCSK